MKNREWDTEVGDALNLAVPLREPPSGLEDRILAAVGSPTRKTRVSWVAGLLAAAVLVLAVGNVVQWSRSAVVSAKPGLMVVMLNGTDWAPKAFGTIILDPDDNHGILAVRDLPVLPEGGRYELWLKRGDDVRSGGAFEVNSDGYGSLSLTVPIGFVGFREFFLSRESPVRTADPVMPFVMKGNF